MTEKEKAEAYDKAIERAKELYGNGITEEIFPELKEDDADRIKKDLIQWVNEFPDIIWRGHYKKDIIAWLEKQDKKSSWKPSKEEMDALYSLSYITNEYDEHKEDVITHLYQDLKREFFNDSSYENMFSLDNKEDDMRRISTIQVLEYARSLDAYNQYGKTDIDKNIAWLKKQGETSPILSNSSNTGKNKPKFDPKTLQPFDKVLVRNCTADKWKCAHFSYMEPSFKGTIYVTSMLFRDRIHYNDNCIPYNDDTKHLVGTTDEAPEFYRYWDD